MRQVRIRVLAAAALLLSGCGPAGVEVAADWGATSFFALASVGDQRVVIGVDVTARRAQSLVVLPSRDDDDPVVAPSMARLNDELTVLAVPRADGRPGRLYRIDRRSASLEVVGSLESGRALRAAGTVLASVADGRPTRVINPETWLVAREVAAVEAAGQATGSPERPVLCVASPTSSGLTGQSISLMSGAVLASRTFPATPVLALACSPQRPVVVVGGPATRADLTAGIITVSGGDIAAALVTDAAVVVAVSNNVDTTLTVFSPDGSREVRRDVLRNFPAVSALHAVQGGYLLLGHAEAAYAAPEGVEIFPLPGPLLSSPE